MKYSVLAKAIGASVLSLSLITLPATVQAQTDGTTTAPGGDAMGTTGTTTEGGDRDFDWGWLGLIGLAGLGGLARKREEPVRYRDPDPANRSGL